MKRKRKRHQQAARGRQNVPAYGTGCVIALSYGRTSEPVNHLADHVPASYTLAKRPTRDDREEELPQLRTADGRVMALVERVDPAMLPN